MTIDQDTWYAGLSWHCLYVKLEGQGHRSKFTATGGKNIAKVVGATSSEGFLVVAAAAADDDDDDNNNYYYNYFTIILIAFMQTVQQLFWRRQFLEQSL